MTFISQIRLVNEHNVRTLRTSPLAELSGALGDLGTLLPLMIAMAIKGSIDLGSTLVFSGLANILTGGFFGIPLPVQPMKAIAAVAISQSFTKEETAAAGLTMGVAVFLLSATGLLRWLHRVVPVSVVKGIQVGAGLSLVISAGTSLVKPLNWMSPAWDNRIWAIAAFVFLLIATLVPRIPYALVVFLFGLIIAATVPGGRDGSSSSAGFWHPSPFVPSSETWKTGAIDAAIPQLPLTTLNSILAVTSLAASLFPTFPPIPSTTSIGFSVAFANLIGCWFGAMPVCHGSGGLAGQYRFGARSGSSIILLGLVKLFLGLFAGDAIIPLLQRFPNSLLGIMVLAAGVELSKVGQSVGEAKDLWQQAEEDHSDEQSSRKSRQATEQESHDRWTVMLITVAGCLAFKNDAVGFLAGLFWYWGLKTPQLIDHVRTSRRSVRLSEAEQHDGLLP
ncbi:Putative molybdate transporter 1/2 [Septoria linicola]|uniref:Molybdate transporter 1/2 n=1 Tax=Septoria linicola TaxID=215465 RepID=A0A9Q9AQM8_9PEZI|nr:putative molybdate transporter 1/2 [Septoria linicola]USW49031.1 Putative molybdate transporter 1/2 [Septoria linicola]